MTDPTQAIRMQTPGEFRPVGPSLIVRIAVRPMTRVFNPLVRRVAGRRHFSMAAQVRHVGRRSGRRYVTPAAARADRDTVIIPLTFGNQSDWARNVWAAGGAAIKMKGTEYEATEPEFVDPSAAGPMLRSAFNPMERLAFRALGIKQVLRLQLVAGGKSAANSSTTDAASTDRSGRGTRPG